MRSSRWREGRLGRNGDLAAWGRRCLVALATLALIGASPAGAKASDVFPIDAIGKLVVDENRVCTAFIIRSIQRQTREKFGGSIPIFENWLVSAGHCNGQELVFRQGTSRHRISRVIGFSAGHSQAYDVMVSIFYTYLRMPVLEPAFGEYPAVSDKLLLIGYGRSALMMRVSPLLRYDERGHMEIDGYASPGNSGGPVLIPGTRRVVGIGIETTLQKPEGASFMYCVLTSCAPKPPYVAAHIDRLLGVANFTLVRAVAP